MSGFLKRYASRRKYRLASALLVAGCLLAALTPGLLGLPSGIALFSVVVSVALYLVLAILTYHRLRDASFSGWWLLPMFVVFHVGPRWEIGSWWWGAANFTPSGFIGFLPVIIGWFAVAKRAEPVST